MLSQNIMNIEKEDRMSGQNKEKMLTARVTEALMDEIDQALQILEKERDPHLSKVTKSEAVIMLLKLGLEEFQRKRNLR